MLCSQLQIPFSRSYRRTSLLILYSFYKNITIAMTQIWFALNS
jgi:magnesium-transporting ATPase (P-type)